MISLLSLQCSSAPEIKIADNIVEDSLKRIAGVTSKDVERALSKQNFSLDDLYVIAIERTERVALKTEMATQSKAAQNRAIAGFLPTLSYVYNKFYQIPGKTDDPTAVENYRTYQAIERGDALYFAPSTSTSSLPPTVGQGSRLLLSFPLTGGFGAYQDYKQYQYLEEQRQLEAKFEAGRLYLEIAQGYFNVLQLQDNLTIANETLALNQDLVNERKRLYSLGKIMRSDLLQAETALANARAYKAEVKSQLDQVQMALGMMIGFESAVTIDSAVAIPNYKLEDTTNSEDYMLKRYDVSSSKKSIEVAKANEKKAMIGFLPNMNLNTYYNFPFAGQTRNKDVIAQLTFTVPLTPITQLADYDVAESATKQAKLTASMTRRNAKIEIENAKSTLEVSERMLSIYEEAYNNAEATLKNQESGYRIGRVSLIDVISTKINTLNAKMTLSRVNYQRHLNRVALGVAIGEIPNLHSEQIKAE
jgi:outer membrane protein TolC